MDRSPKKGYTILGFVYQLYAVRFRALCRNLSLWTEQTIKKRGKAYMKRILCALLAAVMLACCLPLAAGMAADTALDKGLDIVILVDMTKSMDNNSVNNSSAKNSDPKGYRLDAAAMLIAMCDKNSRVAYVPFGGDVALDGVYSEKGIKYVKADSSFDAMDTESARADKIAKIARDKDFISKLPGRLMKDTNIGAALRKAIELIVGREDKQRDPMIVLLTDGSNEMDKNTRSTVYRWDAAQMAFVGNGTKDSLTAANELTDLATDVCHDLQIPVYSISLIDVNYAHKDEMYDDDRKLNAISIKTGGTHLPVEGDTSRLPAYFGKLFADRIGGMPKDLRGRKEEGSNDYVVDIPLLNNSISEVNILLPMEYVEDGSVKLVNKNGSTVSVEEYQIKGAFRLYKIISPNVTQPEVWRLKYRLKNGAPNAPVNLRIIFNYSNLYLKGKIGADAEHLQEIGVLTMSKNGTLHVEALFNDVRTGQPSADSMLYQPQDSLRGLVPDDYLSWCSVSATCSLYAQKVENGSPVFDEDGNPVYKDMPVSPFLTDKAITADTPGNRFYEEINLNGQNLNDGKYLLKIHVSGAGLDREVTREIQLNNEGPWANDIAETYYVDYVPDALSAVDDTHKQAEIKIALNDHFGDDDNDVLTLRLANQENDGLLEGAAVVQDGDNWYFKAKIARQSGEYRYGTYKANISVSEVKAAANSSEANNSIRGATTELNLEISVQSGLAEARRCSFTASLLPSNSGESKQLTGDNPQESVSKYADITQIVTLSSADANIRLKDFDIKLEVKNGTDTVVNNEKLTMDENTQTQRYTFNTKENEATWNAAWSVYYLNKLIGSYEYSIRIENHKPTIAAGQSQTQEKKLAFADLPFALDNPEENPILQFVAEKTGYTLVKDVTDDLSGVFKDEDGDELKYGFSVKTDEDNAAAKLEIKGDKLIITPQAEGDISFTVTATDVDEEKASLDYTVQVLSVWKTLVKWGLIALGAVIALIALILIIRQIRKPVFKPMHLGVREGNAMYDSLEYTLPLTKKAIPMSYVVDSAMASKYNIPDVTLQNLMMEPTRFTDGSIKISNRKSVGTVQVELDGNFVGKHPVRWSPGQELELRAMPSAIEFLRVVLSSESGGFEGGSVDSFDRFGSELDSSGNFGVPDGFDMTSASTFGAAKSGGFDTASSDDLGGGSDNFDIGSSSSSSDIDF